MTSDGARVNLPQETERLVRRIAAVVVLLGTLGAFAVAVGVLGFPFLGFWYLFAPAAASVMVAIVLPARYPLTTPRGRSRATRGEMPAPSMTRTTSSTSL